MGAWVQELGVQELGPAPRANQVIHFAGENAEVILEDYKWKIENNLASDYIEHILVVSCK